MDKNKNRTDLLAAGRKKQYRKKKDNKGSSSHGKSSSNKANKIENDGDAEELSKSHEPLDISAVPSVEDKREQQVLPIVSLDEKEASSSVYRECHSGNKMENESDGVDIQSGQSLLLNEGERSSNDETSLIYTSEHRSQEETGSFDMLEGGASRESFSSHDFTASKGEEERKDDVLLQPERIQGAETSRSYWTGETSSIEETMPTVRSLSQGDVIVRREDGSAVADVEEGRRCGEEYMQQSGMIEVEFGSSNSSELLQDANTNSERFTDIEENLETLRSSIEDVSKEEVKSIDGSMLQSSIVEEDTAKRESLEKLLEQGEVINKEDSQLGIRELLYLTMVERDVFQLQLIEQIKLNIENERQSFDEMLKLRDLVKETQESELVVNEELKQCKSTLQAMTSAKEELETQCLFMKGEMEELRDRASELKKKLDQSQEGFSRVLLELTDCRVSLELLQKENLELKERVFSEEDAVKKLMEEKEFFSFENKKISAELLAQKEQLHSAIHRQEQPQSNLRDRGACFEQLAEENVYVSISLEVYKEKLKELFGRCTEIDSGPQEMPLLTKSDVEDHGRSALAEVLKQHLKDANDILHNLEKSVDGMHSYSVSLSRSGGRAAAPRISKIIQAFESKANVEKVTDESHLIDGRSEDSYISTKEQTYSLRDVLKQMELEVGKADILLYKEPNCRECLNKSVLMSEVQDQQNIFLLVKIDELAEKVLKYKSQILDLKGHMDEMQHNTNEEVARLLSQVEMFQNEANDRAVIMKQEDSIKGTIIEAIEKLNTSTGLQISDGMDVGSRIMTSVDAAVFAIKSLNEETEASHLNYITLQTSFEDLNKSFLDLEGKNEMRCELLIKIYSRIKEFAYDSCKEAGESILDANTDEALQFLPGKFDLLIGHVQKLANERHHLLSTNDELESRLLSRDHEIEELNRRCNALSKKLEDECHSKEGVESLLMNRSNTFEELYNGVLAFIQKLEDCDFTKDSDIDSMIMKSDSLESNLCQSMLLRLEALVSLHVQKYAEVVEQISSSKNYLKEVNIVRDISTENWNLPLSTLFRQEFVPKVSKLQVELQLISALNIQHESEIRILKEGLSEMEEALEASRSELSLKASELEQSEQRLSSVREKLSIAVAKGKGLIVQRDSLKQALAEKTSDLEKSMQEMQSKETMLREVKEKLRSCSEVDRVEALESELSYIRNSATALRDSFLLKDSVLQRIEEVLEDLDLPEHFHSKDIVEKIELLSRLVVTDWDQKSSDAHSHSDAGYVVMDSWKDDITQPSSNHEYDELKRKYEELHNKFYGLAEHNDVLEQSLRERNSLIEKWEDMLDRIEIPSHLKTLEPEDRIESLDRALSDIQQERDNLLRKIENLEDSSDMLIVDLEESHKKISELSAEVVTLRSEKEFFFESLDKLRFEYLALSEKVVHDEVERENLHGQLADLEEQLVKKVKYQEDIEREIHKLHGLVCHALPESETISDGVGISSLEELLTQLIDKYRKSNLNFHGDSEKASQSLVLVEEERDAAKDKCHSLTLEIEEITTQMNQLQEERTHDTEKFQSLLLELETISKDKDNLQEKLTQEEQKAAAAREKLNVAVRKGKALVQQRDALKQAIEEMTTVTEGLKAEHNQRIEVLVSEKSFLVNQLAESERNLHESNQKYSSLLTAFNSIDIGSEVYNIDPVQKIEEIGKLSRDLHSALVYSEQEAKKSKQAAELLLTELNEVQDRTDILQEELTKAEAAKVDALSRLERFTLYHSEEGKKQVNNLVELKYGIDQLRIGCVEFSCLLSDLFRKNVDLLLFVQSFLELIMKQMNGKDVAEYPVLGSSSLSMNPISEENSPAVTDVWQLDSHVDASLITEHLARACFSLHDCTKEYDNLKEKIHRDFLSTRHQATGLLEALDTVKGNLDSQKTFSESLNRDFNNLELAIKEKDNEIFSLHRNLSLLYEACRFSVREIENRKAQVVESRPLEGHTSGDKEHNDGHMKSYTDHSIKMMADSLLSGVKGSNYINEIEEHTRRELKASIFNLQREIQEKDIEMNRISEDLVSQTREADALAKRYLEDLDSSKTQISSLEKVVTTLENDKQLLELKISELKVCEASSKESQDRLKTLTETLAAKDEEINDLMQALDEEVLEVEDLEIRNQELEDTVQEKITALETLETSRSKALAKLSTMVGKFDELHNLSESLLMEVESLQSQLQTRDSEISFLRQEVTRCTNDVLASQETKKKYTSEIGELLIWMEKMVLRFGEPNVHTNVQQDSQLHVYTDILDKKITSVMNELEDLQLTVQSKEDLLQIEKGRVEELLQKTKEIESIHGEEIQREPFLAERDSVQPSSLNSSGLVEIEQVVQRNKVSSPTKTHIRSGRNANGDLAIAIDMEKDDNVLDDEDDDKAHGFKSLIMSRLVPRATRPLTDRIDGIWVSAERLLMRQPSLRLGVIMYWILLHTLLASFI